MCESQVPVPSRDEVARRKIRAIAPRPKEEIGEYGVGAAPLPPPRPRTRLFDRLAEVRQEEIPPPPKWTFFSGVFEFPFRRDVIVRWGFMTGGFLAMALVGYLMLSLARSASSYTGGAVIAFFALPLIWLTFWTCSHAADCCLRVLESTAGGLDRVESWPEPNWRDWMVQLIYLLWLAAVTTVCSYGIAKLAELQGVPLAPVLLASFFTLFPIVLLSSLEAASPWVPLTLPILKSMYRLWWGWLIFYAETGLIVAALAGYVLYVFPQAELLSMLFFGPLLAAALLIYARLLGRLAWRAIEAM